MEFESRKPLPGIEPVRASSLQFRVQLDYTALVDPSLLDAPVEQLPAVALGPVRRVRDEIVIRIGEAHPGAVHANSAPGQGNDDMTLAALRFPGYPLLA